MRRFITTTLAAVAAAAVLALPTAHAATTPTTTATPATTTAAATAADDPVPGKLLLMLDASGSMKAKDPSGLTKIEAAKKSLTSVVTALPDTAQVGLRVYGAKVDGKGKPTPAACADTELVQPVAPLDKTGLTTTISAIKALGETPIAHSLEEAMKDLGTDGKRNIVLVSDGEESCVPDPCPAVKKLTGAGIDLQIDTVGFGVNTTARTQLQCIADAGNGTYYDAKNADQLTTSLSKLSQRALRPFTVSGTPIVGTASASGAPEVTAGQYTDTLTTGDGARHYTVRRTVPGSTLRVALTMRPGYTEDGDNAEHVDMKIVAGDANCASGPAARIGTSHFEHLVVNTLRVAGETPGESTYTEECEQADTVTLSLDRTKGARGGAPTELLVMEEPAVTNLEQLPEADDSQPDQVAPTPADPRPVVGGVSFSSAPQISPGSWSETFVPGETIFYRVPVGWGQRLRLSVLPTPGTVTDEVRKLTHFNAAIHGPDRDRPSDVNANSGTFGSDEPTQQATREVRYRNRETPGTADTDLAGDWFVSIAVPHNRGGNAGLVPMTFRIEVEGDVTGEPSYAGAAPSTSASPSATTDSSSSAASDTTAADSRRDDTGSGPLLWVGLGAVALLGAASAAYTIVRTRRVRN